MPAVFCEFSMLIYPSNCTVSYIVQKAGPCFTVQCATAAYMSILQLTTSLLIGGTSENFV